MEDTNQRLESDLDALAVGRDVPDNPNSWLRNPDVDG
jgi:hypothetical protein